MSWFKLDDKFHGHRKTLELFDGPCPADSIALWALSASWCADQLTDGRVPISFIRRSGLDRRAADELVRVRLWERDGDGYRFRKYLTYQKSREKVLKERTDAKARKGGGKGPPGDDGSREPSGSSGEGSREPDSGSADARANLSKVQPNVARGIADPSAEKSRSSVAPIRSGSDPISSLGGGSDLGSGSSPAREASAPPSRQPGEPATEQEARAVSTAWNVEQRLVRLDGLHAFDQWRREFYGIAEAVALRPGDRGIAAIALCAWFWRAVDGPVKGNRFQRRRPHPEALAKHAADDLDRASAWWSALAEAEQDAILADHTPRHLRAAE